MEDLKVTCRTCLGPLDFPRNLFETAYTKLLELLHRLLGFEVHIDGGVFNICRNCEGKLNWVSEFQIICEKSLERFKNIETKNEFIKEEDILSSVHDIEETGQEIDEEDDESYSPDDNSDSDSDYRVDSPPKKRRKDVAKPVKRSPRTKRKRKSVIVSEPKKISKRCKQFPESEVLQAIEEANAYMTDLKNRQCLCCDYVASTATTLRMHMSWKHKETFKTWCKHCNVKTNNLREHQELTNCCENRCKFCNKLCIKSNKLSEHLRTHCHKAFSELQSVVQEEDAKRLKQFPAEDVIQAITEYESYMTDMKNRQCIVCPYIGPTAKLLRMHMTRKHEEEFRHWCKNCNLQTEDLQIHTDSVKCNEEECRFCNKIFSNMKYFTQHLRTHCQIVKDNKANEESRWKACAQFPKDKVLQAIAICTAYMSDLKHRTCLYCDFIAPTSRTLTVHMKFCHKEYNETWCGRCNLQTEHLPLHLETVKCFENICVLCNKMFTKINRLTRHLESHCRDEFRKPDDHVNWDEELNIINPPSVAVPPTPDVAISTENPNTNTIDKNTHETNGENICDKKREEDSEPSDTNISDQDSDYDDDYEEITDGRRRRGKQPELKQYSQKKVQDAITESMRGFYTNRKCVVCSYVTSNCKALANHMASHKTVKHRWCSRCNKIVSHLSKHLPSHKKDILKCVFCGRSSDTIEYLKDHLKRHCRSHEFIMRPKWFSCKICPASFPAEDKLKDHKCKEILGSAFCLLCKKRVNNLRVHMVHKHSNDSTLKETMKSDARKTLCPVCGKTFIKDRSLAAHMYTHTGDMPYKCSYCDKGFPNVSILRSHEKRHIGERSFVCHVCGKGFVYANDHNKHVKTHEGGPVQCHVCKKEFKRPGLLKLHMRRHTGENQYHCVYCGLSFHQRSLLLIHMSRHNKNKRPYKCSFCQKDFRNPNTLKKHEDIHRGIKPYKCSVCFFSSTHSHVLKSHMKQHPEDLPQADRPHKCQFCNRQFETNAMLMSHTDIYHRESSV